MFVSKEHWLIEHKTVNDISSDSSPNIARLIVIHLLDKELINKSTKHIMAEFAF